MVPEVRMRRVFHGVVVAMVAVEALVVGQGVDLGKVAGVVASARQALGGSAAGPTIKSLTATGRVVRARNDGSTAESDFEIAIELPDKYMKRDVLAAIGDITLYRHSGFNGDTLIDATDAPPGMSATAAGGGMRVTPSSTGRAGQPMTAAEREEAERKMLQTIRQDYTRLALGMFMMGAANYPVEFAYAGQAEAATGKADVLEVKGAGDFNGKLFLDGASHMPLMLSWMDKEPLVFTMGPGDGAARFSSGSGTLQVVTGGGRQSMSPEDIAQMQRDMETRRQEADAKRRVVEYRMFYADYKAFDGIKLPTRIQKTIEGRPSEELTFRNVKINPKIDAKKFK
jgi:hypothetical protein